MMKSIRTFFASALALFAVIMCMSVTSFASYNDGTVIFDDQADLYTDAQEQELIKRQKEVASHTGWNIALVTTDIDFPEDGYKAIEYAESYYDSCYGYDSSGVLYLIDLGYRQFVTSGTADFDYFNDARVQSMISDCNVYYYDYDDMGNANCFYDHVESVYDAGPFDKDAYNYEGYTGGRNGRGIFNFPVAIFIGLIAGGICIGVIVSRYKFHYQPSANNYLESGKINFYLREDRYIREYTTRTKIESSSGGGGGSHGSSGGHSHGGGGSGGHR